MFGKTYSWSEFRELSLTKEKLYNYCKYHKLNKAYIHRLLGFYELYMETYYKALESLKSKDIALVQNRNKLNLYYNVEGNPEKTAYEAAYYSEWFWRFFYYNAKTKERIKDLKPNLEQLENDIIENRKIKDLYMPARWAELLLKEKRN